MLVKQTIPCLDTMSKKTENITNIKNHMVLWKNSKNYLKKPKWFWETTSRFLSKRKKEMLAGHVGVFCQNLVYALENYINFKNVLLNNRSILEINYYYKIRGNVSFTELSEIKNTLSNQDFAGLDKFNNLEENLFCMHWFTMKFH